jgi:hypothetical protein
VAEDDARPQRLWLTAMIGIDLSEWSVGRLLYADEIQTSVSEAG